MTSSPAVPIRAFRSRLALLQWLTLGWMLIECAVSLVSAMRAHSPALLAFGADSFVELLSAALVLLTISPRLRIDQHRANLAAGSLLFILAAIVATTSSLAFAGRIQPRTSPFGIAITAAALCVMPFFAWYKRKLARQTGNNTLAADAVQSASCAYLAAITLAGLLMNAVFGIASADSVAALVAIPILLVEGQRAVRGQSCGCHAACDAK
jgi:divalent metal cation (Fe/Co/Zn/Cd) transporter